VATGFTSASDTENAIPFPGFHGPIALGRPQLSTPGLQLSEKRFLMRRSITPTSAIQPNGNNKPTRLGGLVVFCEKKLQYEKGLKAWIFLGPYLVGTFALEMEITGNASSTITLGPWLGFLIYLVLFPFAWRRILKLVAGKKAPSFAP
jgi:hypothetical protein